MADLIKRKIAIIMDIEYVEDSPVFGKVTDEFLTEHVNEQLKGMFVSTDIHPEEGDLFRLTNASAILKQSYLDTVCLIHPDDFQPTDEETVRAEFERDGTPLKYLAWEIAVRKLENEGLTRSDAQGALEVQYLDPDSPFYKG